MQVVTLCDLTLTKSVTTMFIHVQSQSLLDLDNYRAKLKGKKTQNKLFAVSTTLQVLLHFLGEVPVLSLYKNHDESSFPEPCVICLPQRPLPIPALGDCLEHMVSLCPSRSSHSPAA